MAFSVDPWAEALRPVPQQKHVLFQEQVEANYELIDSSGVSDGAKKLFRILVDAAMEVTRVFFKQQTMATMLGVTRRTICRYVKELKGAGLLLILHKNRRSPAYSVVPGAVIPSSVDPGKRWLEPMSQLTNKGPAAPSEGIPTSLRSFRIPAPMAPSERPVPGSERVQSGGQSPGSGRPLWSSRPVTWSLAARGLRGPWRTL